MTVSRYLLLSCLLLTVVFADLTETADTPDTSDHAEDVKPRILLRKRRTPNLPATANIRFESKLIVPQTPTGLYQIWFGPVRFFIQQLFSATRWVSVRSDQVGPSDLTWRQGGVRVTAVRLTSVALLQRCGRR